MLGLSLQPAPQIFNSNTFTRKYWEPKKTPKPKNRTNSAKEFSEQFEGVTGHYPLSFEGNRTRKFTRKFGEIFVAKVLWGTFSVPENRLGRVHRFYDNFVLRKCCSIISSYGLYEPKYAGSYPKYAKDMISQGCCSRMRSRGLQRGCNNLR